MKVIKHCLSKIKEFLVAVKEFIEWCLYQSRFLLVIFVAVVTREAPSETRVAPAATVVAGVENNSINQLTYNNAVIYSRRYFL